MRKCPFHGCERQIPDSVFACRPHWFSLNKADKTRIHDVYNAYTSDQLTVDELRQAQQEVLGDRGTA